MKASERIKLIRKDKNMTQEQFGEVLGVSRDVIGNIEYDRLKRPEQKEPIYRLICQKFNVNEKWLHTGEGDMYATLTKAAELAKFTAEVFNGEDDNFKSRFISMLLKLDTKEWELLENIAQKLVEEEKQNKKD